MEIFPARPRRAKWRTGTRKTRPQVSGPRIPASPATSWLRLCTKTESSAAWISTDLVQNFTSCQMTQRGRAKLFARWWKGCRRSKRARAKERPTLFQREDVDWVFPTLCRGGFDEAGCGWFPGAFGMECARDGIPRKRCTQSCEPRARSSGRDIHLQIPAALSYGGENAAGEGSRVRRGIALGGEAACG